MAGRVVEYKPAAPRPFDEVKDEIRRQLVRGRRARWRRRRGREKLALLEQGKTDKEAGVTFGKPVSVLRNQMQPGFSPDALTAVFRVDAAKLPQYVGATNERGGYSIYRVQKRDAAAHGGGPVEARGARAAGSASCRAASCSTPTSHRSRHKADVRINQANLEKK